MMRVVVVDDEELPRQRVKDLVAAHSALELVGEAGDGATALDVIAQHAPDLVFLDIQMPELNGFEVIAAIDEARLPAIVFVTAYDAYALRAFEVDAIDYLLKPVSAERFASAVERVIGRLRARDTSHDPAHDHGIRAMASRAIETRGTPVSRFVARRGTRHYFVRVADIDWIEAEGNYVRLQTGERSHLIRETMNGIEARLDPAQFIRVHRSVFVAVERIHSIEAREQGEYVLTMPGGRTFVSSRGYSERVRALLR